MQGLAEREVGQQAQQYQRLLEALNDVAHHEVDAWLREQPAMSEPYVARCLSERLPPGQLQPQCNQCASYHSCRPVLMLLVSACAALIYKSPQYTCEC